MSDLEKTSLKNRLNKSGDMASLPPMGNPPQGHGIEKKARTVDYSPTHWSEYFSGRRDVTLDEQNVFCVYELGTAGPVILFLHGGGYSGLSFALCASALSKVVTCRCVAIDIRGHGDTMTSNDTDLSVETLSTDIGHVVEKMFGEHCPPIILIGHSMGGAIAVHVSRLGLLPTLQGLVVIDVVEGTAMDSLNSMQSFLRSRPLSFTTLCQAIQWSHKSGQIKNVESARVSIPGHLQKTPASEAASVSKMPSFSTCSFVSHGEVLTEEEEEDVVEPQEETEEFVYTWRIDLSQTERHWKGWFQGLTQHFLAVPVPKLLLLAGMDRLDKDLTIGQMQGKYHLQVLPQCGHAVHEDLPDRVADVLSTFLVRNRFAAAVANFERCISERC